MHQWLCFRNVGLARDELCRAYVWNKAICLSKHLSNSTHQTKLKVFVRFIFMQQILATEVMLCQPTVSPTLKLVVLLPQHHRQVPPWLAKMYLQFSKYNSCIYQIFSIVDIGDFILKPVTFQFCVFNTFRRIFEDIFFELDILLKVCPFQRILTSIIQEV